MPFSPMTALSVMPAKIISTTIVTSHAFRCCCWFSGIFCTPFVYAMATVFFRFYVVYFFSFFFSTLFLHYFSVIRAFLWKEDKDCRFPYLLSVIYIQSVSYSCWHRLREYLSSNTVQFHLEISFQIFLQYQNSLLPLFPHSHLF